MRMHFFTPALLHSKEWADKGKVWGHSVPEFAATRQSEAERLFGFGTGWLSFLDLMLRIWSFFALPSRKL